MIFVNPEAWLSQSCLPTIQMAYNIPGNQRRRQRNARIQKDSVIPRCFQITAAGGHINAVIRPTIVLLALLASIMKLAYGDDGYLRHYNRFCNANSPSALLFQSLTLALNLVGKITGTLLVLLLGVVINDSFDSAH